MPEVPDAEDRLAVERGADGAPACPADAVDEVRGEAVAVGRGDVVGRGAAVGRGAEVVGRGAVVRGGAGGAGAAGGAAAGGAPEPKANPTTEPGAADSE